MSHQQVGALIALAGLVLVVIGLVTWVGGLSWFGSLPGDLRWGGDRTRVYVPITSMIILSIVLSLLLYLLRRLL
jgi:hypothetical protein